MLQMPTTANHAMQESSAMPRDYLLPLGCALLDRTLTLVQTLLHAPPVIRAATVPRRAYPTFPACVEWVHLLPVEHQTSVALHAAPDHINL